MLHQTIDKPFGDDEDANRAIGSVLSLVSQLSIEGHRLVGARFPNITAREAQRDLVVEIRERIDIVAHRHAVDPDRFLEAARQELERRTRRGIEIVPIAHGAGSDDATQQSLDRDVQQAETARDNALSELRRAQRAVGEAESSLIVAEQAASSYRAAARGRRRAPTSDGRNRG